MNCSWRVTTCSQATVALNLLRERKGCFDVVLSDVHMPDMDGFKLLELVGLEMDLPVIMMSADGRTSVVMMGIRHGACDYLIKPIREEELKNIWQHVVRKRWHENKEHEHSGSLDDNDRNKRGNDDAEYASSANEGTEGILRTQKKKRDMKEEEDGELENDDPSASKKPRVVWSVELHQQFVSAVNQLGIDSMNFSLNVAWLLSWLLDPFLTLSFWSSSSEAVPKRILELMNVPGLTRENVASHLQKFRLYLKRLSGVAQQQGGIPTSFCGSVEQNPKLGPLGIFDIQALAASGQIPPQTLAALHAELLGRPTGNLVLPAMDQPALLQASLQGSKCISVDHGVAYGQPPMKCSTNIPKQFPHQILSTEDVHSGFGSWTSHSLCTLGAGNNPSMLGAQNGNMLVGMLQNQQRQQQQQHQQKPSMLTEHSHSINVQPSCLVVPSQSSASFQAGNSPGLVNPNGNFSRSSVIDYSIPVPQSNNSSFVVGQLSNGDLKTTGVLNRYSGPNSISPSVSSSSVNADNNAGQKAHNLTTAFTAGIQLPGLVPNATEYQGSSNGKSTQVLDQGPLRNLGFVGKGTSIPSRFAVDEPDEPESPIRNLNHPKFCVENCGKNVKEEPHLDYIENARVGTPILQHFSPNDLMSVFSE
ncbi:hypothetical protein RJ639_024445 [Escallonia herrerae]|uniref:Response regulatory domain-containing protein n=1 Tax=Escallonia herrerae TaxID=1293975 RepID=A0AA88V0B4_9ASTE|nr:hypothetical protein RJ639_024445 [Escallonia herrerae]